MKRTTGSSGFTSLTGEELKMREVALGPNELAMLLEKALIGGLDTTKLSRLAYGVYQQYGLDLTPEMDRIILTLMAMEEGPEFELNESDVRDLIAKLASL
ncbi:hypothetical protein [Agrobacterium tumefaciens]|uniref:hypothetical protein n=1 Tax=Agrobacterium tumefaciens TaxID=358 RepID=UPI001177A47F|nr:hypothetical protein [Agrobacterium tumefaciens]